MSLRNSRIWVVGVALGVWLNFNLWAAAGDFGGPEFALRFAAPAVPAPFFLGATDSIPGDATLPVSEGGWPSLNFETGGELDWDSVPVEWESLWRQPVFLASTPVPEPSGFLIGLLGAAMLARTVRARRQERRALEPR